MPQSVRPLALLVCLLFVCTAAGLYLLTTRDIYKPLHRLEQQDFPVFADDMDIDSLIDSAKHQTAYLKRQEPGKKWFFGEDVYDTGRLLDSVQQLLAKLQQRPDAKQFNQFVHDNFLIYQAGGRTSQRGRRMLVTGYYEPVFDGSLIWKPPFINPIYSLPDTLVTLAARDGGSKIGRYDENGAFVPFWSRGEIEEKNLLQGYELAFLKDPFDAFLLHVQGSGKVRLPDNSLRSVRFAGSNGLEYNSIGKLLVDEKALTLKEVSVPALRKYLQRHPEERQRILYHNPRYIFFSWGDTSSPSGSSGESLTPGRSIAIDSSALPGGAIGYLVSRRPIVNQEGNISAWKPLNRIVFPQDSGAAIKGTGRVDIFWGNGDYAEFAANHMKETGKLFFLVKKESSTVH